MVCYNFTVIYLLINDSFTLHETGNGNGNRTRSGNDGFIFMPLTVHTIQRQGTGPGTNGLHTLFPIPGPGPAQCE